MSNCPSSHQSQLGFAKPDGCPCSQVLNLLRKKSKSALILQLQERVDDNALRSLKQLH
jgi:hypothetical protein